MAKALDDKSHEPLPGGFEELFASSLERQKLNSERYEWLKKQAGHWQDGSQTTVLLDQDDATRTAFVKIGEKYYSHEAGSFDAAIDAAMSARRE